MTKTKRIIFFLLLITLAFTLACLPVAAAEEGGAKAYEWEYDHKNCILKNSDKEYKMYELPVGYGSQPKDRVYVFKNHFESSYLDLYSYARDGELVWQGSDDGIVYATSLGKEYIDALVGGSYSSLALCFEESFCDLDESFTSALDAYAITGVQSLIDVTELSADVEYQIRGYDETGSLYYVYGAIYEYSDGYYYVNYSLLPNHFFNADGSFSYRNGEVSMTRIDGALLDEFLRASENLEYDTEYTFEEDETEDTSFLSYSTRAIIRFGVIAVAVGYVLPAVIGIISVMRARKTIPEHKRLWYITAGASGLWIAISIAVTLIFILG